MQEIARQGPKVRKAFEESLNNIFTAAQKGRPNKENDKQDRQWAIAVSAMMVGGLAYSRAVQDEELSAEILEACRTMARRVAEAGDESEKENQ